MGTVIYYKELHSCQVHDSKEDILTADKGHKEVKLSHEAIKRNSFVMAEEVYQHFGADNYDMPQQQERKVA